MPDSVSLALVGMPTKRIADLGPATDAANLAKAGLDSALGYYEARTTITDVVEAVEYRWCLQMSNGIPHFFLSDVAVDPTYTDDKIITDVITGTQYEWSLGMSSGILQLILEEVI